jgi:DNA polymerase-1
MNKLVLIDGNAIMHRAYHALPPFKTKKGEPVGAIYGFISMLLKVVQDLRPTHIAVCFDRHEPTFRKQMHEAYQAHRPGMDKDLIPQFKKAKKVMKAFRIPVYEKAGFEADDVIGTIAKKTRVGRVIIVTGDKDILQLVDEKIKVYLPVKGLSQGKLMSTHDVMEKMGVRPERVDDYKALVGDPSDNYKGVPGIGPKTAVSLLEQFDDLEGVYKNLKKIPANVRNKLVDGKKSADMSYRLAKIVTNLSFKFSLKKAGKWQLDSQEINHLLREFGFKRLRERVQKIGKAMRKEQQIKLL